MGQLEFDLMIIITIHPEGTLSVTHFLTSHSVAVGAR